MMSARSQGVPRDRQPFENRIFAHLIAPDLSCSIWHLTMSPVNAPATSRAKRSPPQRLENRRGRLGRHALIGKLSDGHGDEVGVFRRLDLHQHVMPAGGLGIGERLEARRQVGFEPASASRVQRFLLPLCAIQKTGRSVLKKVMLLIAALVCAPAALADQLPLSPAGVKTLAPEGAIKPTGTWNLGTRAGDFVFVAGMRGIDPKTNLQVQGDEARIRQAFLNMKLIAESEGANLRDTTRIVVYVTDMYRFRPIVNKIQEELWGQGPYPPRTIIEVHRLNGDDIFEVEGTFYAPKK
jgi:2-iminobutanoate/2-iminopropanoate deaminase